MPLTKDGEQHAIRKLIAEIDSLDARRDRPGRIVLALFFAAFLCSAGLLVYTVSHAHPGLAPSLPAPGSLTP